MHPTSTCPYGDPYCPCQDGDPCNYVDEPGSPGEPPPTLTELAERGAILYVPLGDGR